MGSLVQTQGTNGRIGLLKANRADITIPVNTTVGVSYAFEITDKAKKTGTLWSYDVPDITRVKADYIISKGLAGAMFWGTSAY